MIKTITICDVCERELSTIHETFRSDISDYRFLVVESSHALSNEQGGHLCSQYCVQQALIRYLSKIEEAAVRRSQQLNGPPEEVGVAPF